MVHSADLNRLRAFVHEIKSYYAINQYAPTGELTVSRSMVSFALFDLTEEQLDELLISLQQQGHLVSIKGDRLVFPASFINAKC